MLAFTRAVGDPGPRAAGEVVPPTFTACAAIQDPAHMRGLRPVGAPARAAAEGSTVLHAEQHFEYLALVRVGDVLTMTESSGDTWTKPGRDGGTLRFSESVREFRDAGGDLVVRSRMVTVIPDGAPR